MTARDDIARLLEEWRELSEAETATILAEHWPSLKEIQAAKSRLQSSMSDAMARWSAENGGTRTKAAPIHPFRTEVNRLISLEARNGQLLAAQMRKTQSEKNSQVTAVSNLRRVQRSYGRKQEAGWNSYS